VIELKTDYLIIGAGAVGMAFADILLSETEAHITIVDRHHKAGGHWNVAYPFVTLHQPSAFYGVSSRELSKGRIDKTGLNKGLADLASGAEVSAYFDDIMRHDFLPTGRVAFYPMCDFEGPVKGEGGVFTNRLSGQRYRVTPSEKTVDATYLKTTVPSTHIPNFTVAEDTSFITLNDLTKIETPPAGYIIIGGGKTGIDACLWLLENGVDPDAIRWIKSRDAWLLDRKNTQVTDPFFFDTIGTQAEQFEAIADSDSIEDMFTRLEACGYFLRLDLSVRPSMFHGATISQAELTQLRRIKNIIRKGRVSRIEPGMIYFGDETLAVAPDQIYVDCSASAISNLDMKPVFAGPLITPQTVRSYQPVFSAAFIAHIETAFDTEVEKNNYCGVVPLPDTDMDYIRLTVAFMMNQYKWAQNPEIRHWLQTNRLDGFSDLTANVGQDIDKKAVLARLSKAVMPAMSKLQKYLETLA